MSKPFQITDLSHYRWAAQTGGHVDLRVPVKCRGLPLKKWPKGRLGSQSGPTSSSKRTKRLHWVRLRLAFPTIYSIQIWLCAIFFIANLLWLLASVQPGYAKVEFTVAVQSKFTIWPHTKINHRRSLLHNVTFPSAVCVRHHIIYNTYCMHICNFFIHVKNYIQSIQI